MSIKLLTKHDMQKYTLLTIKKLLKLYNSIEFNIEIQRDDFSKKKITILLENK